MASPAVIREEAPEDVAAIRAVNVVAFERPAEADLVDSLRDAGAVTLSLVAERDGRIVGHILFSPVTIQSPEEAFPAVGLGPIAVEPGLQRSGIGSALVRAGLSALGAAGQEVVVVLGHPEYYPRLGFVKASDFGIRWEQDVPGDALMVLELTPGALAGRRGVVRYRPEFAGL